MNADKVMTNVDSLFAKIFPTANDEYLDSGFRDIVKSIVESKEGTRIVTVEQDSVDTEWLSFLWWVFKRDDARINDAIHGRIWLPDGRVISSVPTGSFYQTTLIDPIAHAERIKIKDYLKHINWIFHKTQNLPNIVLIGSDNVPERIYGLRQSKITLLDPKSSLPKEKLFDDHIQRKNFEILTSNAVFDELGSHRDIVGTQNVVIIDQHNPHTLAEKIHEAGQFLTNHGRILFDIPMYQDCLQASYLFRVAQIMLGDFDRPIQNGLTTMDVQIHKMIRNINELTDKNDYYFEIEEIKLTDAGLDTIDRSVAMRVYLKKNYID